MEITAKYEKATEGFEQAKTDIFSALVNASKDENRYVRRYAELAISKLMRDRPLTILSIMDKLSKSINQEI